MREVYKEAIVGEGSSTGNLRLERSKNGGKTSRHAKRRERDDDKFVRKGVKDESSEKIPQNEVTWFEKIKEEILTVK